MDSIPVGKGNDGEIKKFFSDYFDAEVEVFSAIEEENALISFLNSLLDYDSDLDSSGNPDRQISWEKGWNENYRAFLKEGLIESLIPKYGSGNFFRFRGRFVKLDDTKTSPASSGFSVSDLLFFHVFSYLTSSFFSNFDHVVEFGCGTCLKLVVLHNLFPSLKLFGCDWAQANLDIADKLSERFGIVGKKFDMLTLDGGDDLPSLKNAGVLTVASMEQLGNSWQPFFNFVLRCQPKIVVHFESVEEFYGRDRLFDLSAMLYHRKRNYLKSYLSALKSLEKKGCVEILESKRFYLGDNRHEGSNLVVWKPA